MVIHWVTPYSIFMVDKRVGCPRNLWIALQKKLNVRIISPDRPGVGISTFQESRQFLDWGNDIAQLADFLGLNKYSIFGLSGGAPHVLACIISDSLRIENASIVSGATPYDYKGTLKGMWFPVKLVHWFASWKKDK